MRIETFDLERIQSLWENRVEYNLTESGLHPFSLNEILDESEIKKLLSTRLGYGQTDGSIELRQSIARLYPGMSIENVLVTNGSAEANFLVTWSRLESGDELVLMLPNYMQIWGLARAFSVEVKPFYLKESLGWAADLDGLKRAVSRRTRMIAICNPNNPTGAVLTEDQMDEIVKLAEKTGAWIYADEIYRGAELSGKETPSFIGRTERVIVSGGLSKAYGLPGLRLGWLVGPADAISAAWSYRDYTSISSGIISQLAGTRVLQPDLRSRIFARNRAMLRENLQLLKGWVISLGEGFHYHPPQAGGMVFLNYNLPLNSRLLATRLREEKSVFVMDGDCFGMDNYLRIGIGSEKHYFQQGLKRMAEFLQDLKA